MELGLQCRVCAKRFSEFRVLNQHLKVVHQAEPEVRKRAFACDECKKTYGRNETLRVHKKAVHGTIGSNRLQKSKILCPSCNHKLTTHDALRTHIRSHHNVALECDELSFSTLPDFHEWKNKQEKESHSTYIKTTASRTLSGEERKSFYFCHRAGYFKSKSNTCRAMKSQGSCKIGSTCPSSMIVVESPSTAGSSVIKVTFWKTHVGHTASLAHLHCTAERRTALAGKIAEGVTLDRILDDLRDEVKDRGGKAHLEHPVTRHDLRNIRKDFIKKEKNQTTSRNILVEKISLLQGLSLTSKVAGEDIPRAIKHLDSLIDMFAHESVASMSQSMNNEPANKKIETQPRFKTTSCKRKANDLGLKKPSSRQCHNTVAGLADDHPNTVNINIPFDHS